MVFRKNAGTLYDGRFLLFTTAEISEGSFLGLFTEGACGGQGAESFA
ncbi:hypothetical protein [Mesorhizobium sp.]|nr:hypothetical protein [Mesorhizobium sp.]